MDRRASRYDVVCDNQPWKVGRYPRRKERQVIRHSFRPVMLAALVLIVAGVYPREARGS